MKTITANEATIREAFGRLVYTYKAHLKAMDIDGLCAVVIKWVNIILTSITSGTLLSTLFLDKQLTLVATIFSTIDLAFVIFQLSFDPEKSAQAHKQAADKLFILRERYLGLIAGIADKTMTLEQSVTQRDRLTDETARVYTDSPKTGPLSYWLARRALKINEEFTFSSKEIDAFLPKELHQK